MTSFNQSEYCFRHHLLFFLKNGSNPASFVYFRSFQTNNTIPTTNQCEKMSCPSSVHLWDLNPRPSECVSPPIATRLGLPPHIIYWEWSNQVFDQSFFKKIGQPRPLLSFTLGLQTNVITILTTNTSKKYPSSIQCLDSNPQPLEHESPPITSRPELPQSILLVEKS